MTLILFVPACFALNMVPGPNNLLSMSNAQRFGFKYAVGAGFGRLAAFVIMIFLAATGLATILYASETLFFVIKTIGALYLLWVAVQLWRSNTSEQGVYENHGQSIMLLAKQEFFLAAGNPKAILIFTAFLPQFVNMGKSTDSQFVILGTAFVVLELLAIALYACFGVYLRGWFERPRMNQLFNRICAGFIGILGIGLLVEGKTEISAP
ncbi:LysE family translocator [Thalassotalea fusca]